MKTIILLLLLLFLPSCLVVNYERKDVKQAKAELSSRSQIELSQEYVLSLPGDVIAFLPMDWFFIDAKSGANPNIFGIAVNPDYSLSMIFSSFTKTASTISFAKDYDLIALAKLSLEQQNNKSGGKVKLIGDIKVINIGSKSFAVYKTSTTAGALMSHTSVFFSEFGNPYRMSLVPMDILGKAIPSQSESEKIFISVLTGVNY